MKNQGLIIRKLLKDLHLNRESMSHGTLLFHTYKGIAP